MPKFIDLIGGGVFALGLTFSVYGVGRFITNIPAGVISEKVGRKWIITIGGLGVALFATLGGFAQDVPTFLTLRFLSGVASSMTIVMANVVAADLSTVENRGRVLGLMHGLQLVVGTGSPALGGLIGEVFGTRAPFYVSGIMVLTFALWGIVRLPETRPQPGSADAGPQIRHSNSPRGGALPPAGHELPHGLHPRLLHVLPARGHVYDAGSGIRTRGAGDGAGGYRVAVHLLVAHARDTDLSGGSDGGQVRAEDRHHSGGSRDRRSHRLGAVRGYAGAVPRGVLPPAYRPGVEWSGACRLRCRPRADGDAGYGDRAFPDVRRRRRG